MWIELCSRTVRHCLARGRRKRTGGARRTTTTTTGAGRRRMTNGRTNRDGLVGGRTHPNNRPNTTAVARDGVFAVHVHRGRRIPVTLGLVARGMTRGGVSCPPPRPRPPRRRTRHARRRSCRHRRLPRGACQGTREMAIGHRRHRPRRRLPSRNRRAVAGLVDDVTRIVMEGRERCVSIGSWRCASAMTCRWCCCGGGTCRVRRRRRRRRCFLWKIFDT
mmetsp:Transcript_46725/g.56583  ORF Transcript_46725/g.56583 Transcript_46725/m.56583 type:complete len:219 (+) Transcript_46725:1441-2097(+)